MTSKLEAIAAAILVALFTWICYTCARTAPSPQRRPSAARKYIIHPFAPPPAALPLERHQGAKP